jgi:hypothetical protein
MVLHVTFSHVAQSVIRRPHWLCPVALAPIPRVPPKPFADTRYDLLMLTVRGLFKLIHFEEKEDTAEKMGWVCGT